MAWAHFIRDERLEIGEISNLQSPISMKHLLALLLLLSAVACTAPPPASLPPTAQPFGSLNPTPLPADIGRYVTVTIMDGEQQLFRQTAAPTVRQLLVEAGITLDTTDTVEPALDSPVWADMTVVIGRAEPFTIIVDGGAIPIASNQSQVAAVLAAAGVTLGALDYTRPSSDTLLQPGDTIEVVRVTESFRYEDTPIPYETVWQPSDQFEIDTEGLLTAGQPGIFRRQFRLRYENGVEISHTFDREWIEAAPINELMGYGTRLVIRTLETPDGPVEYWRVVEMRVTSYTALSSGKPISHPAFGVTASGLYARTGIVAVDKSIVPFESWVYVPNYGVGYAGDTGGGIIGRWIDLGYNRYNFVPWSGYTLVYYLTPAPPPEEINYRLPETLP
jgi:3D (Asp-Asp-Asp) domain-containing protein